LKYKQNYYENPLTKGVRGQKGVSGPRIWHGRSAFSKPHQSHRWPEG
jgi:hypothetical protein